MERCKESIGVKKSIFRKRLKEERKEAKIFGKQYAKIMQDFNDFMFGSGCGSFIQFDARYRELAEQEYKYIKPDKLDFYKFAIENDGEDINNFSPKFNFPIGFIKEQPTKKVQR